MYNKLVNGLCKPTKMPRGHRLTRLNMGKEHFDRGDWNSVIERLVDI